MNETELEKVLRCYRPHERHRAYATDAAGNRQLVAIFRACLDTRDGKDVLPIFHRRLEQLTDTFGANLLRPTPKEPRRIPPPWKDAHGNVMASPFITGDAKGQRVLKQHDPELAAYYEASAGDRYGFEQSLRDEEADRVEQNRLEAEYSSEIHEHNVFADPSALETDKADFVAKFPKRAAIYKREALPVRAVVFGRGRNQTIRGKVLKTDPALWAVVEKAEQHHAALEEEAELAAQKEREQAEAKIAELRQKSEKLSDGRIVTLAR